MNHPHYTTHIVNDGSPALDWSTAFQQTEASAFRAQPELDIQLSGLDDFSAVALALRQVHLQGNEAILPYRNAAIRPKQVSVNELSPLSLYVLDKQLRQQQVMFWHLLSRYNQCLFDLTGAMNYRQSGTDYRLAPVIVETYYEPTTNNLVTAIIDGLHRVTTAKHLGLATIWVVEITNVPADLLPIALPVTWEDVAVYDAVPREKRRYRYQKREDLPSSIAALASPDNFTYFLYRDLAPLGSSGVRQAGT